MFSMTRLEKVGVRGGWSCGREERERCFAAWGRRR
jgi:hypothetical protein